MKNISIKLISIILAFILCICILAPSPISAEENEEEQKEGFEDVPQYWATEYIYWGVRNGIIKGYEDKTFRPNQQITEAEFAAVLARYVTNIDVSKLEKIEGRHWSQHIYNALAEYQLPFKGYNNDEIKDTGLTRGRIAQIIAAKNGFNLTERQAIYYMYENDISNGLIPGELSFESYGADKPVLREQIPGFFYRLNSLGVTTFMGKPSPVENQNEMVGIVDVPPSDVEITDEMFKELGIEKGIIDEDEGKKGTLSNPIVINNGAESVGTEIYWEVIKEHPELANKLVAKINGIVTPVDPTITRGYKNDDSGMILTTCIRPDWANMGFKDKDLFLKIAREYWSEILDENQIKIIEEMMEKHYNKIGVTPETLRIKGETHDMRISGGGGELGVTIYEKGHMVFD